MEKQVFYDFKCHFNLRSKRTDKATSVYLVFRTNDGKQYKINTRAKVYSNQWNNGKVISSTINDMKNNTILLQTISEYKTKFYQFKNYLCNTNNADIEQAISIFFNYKAMAKKAEKQTKCLTLLLNEVIDKSDSREKSKIQYHSIVSAFKQFLSDKNIPNSLESATLQILEQYQSYLLNEKSVKRQTINNKTTVLTTLLDKLSRTESTINIDSIKKLGKLKVDKDIKDDKFVVLPIEDIKKLLDTNIDNEGKEFKDIEKLVKDIFCLECLSAQRIKDILDLLENRDNEIKESENIRFILHVCSKTHTKCLIPLNIFDIDTQSLLNRIYDNKELAKLLGNNTNNITEFIDKKIKSIFKRLGYNSIVKWKEQDKNNNLVDKQDYFYNRISTHSGRRSFITNCAIMGLTDNIIMLFSGHKRDEMLNRYKKLNDSDKINMAANAINKLHGVPNNIPSSTTVSTNSNTDNELLEESKKVLAYLGANAIEIADIKGIDEAMRMLYQNYEYKLKQMGLTATQIKEIYNSDRPTLKAKREALLKLIEDVEAKKDSLLQ